MNNNNIQIGAVGGPYAEGLFHSASTYINGGQTFACYKAYVYLKKKVYPTDVFTDYQLRSAYVYLKKKVYPTPSMRCSFAGLAYVYLKKKVYPTHLHLVRRYGKAYVYLKKKVYPTIGTS